MTPWLRLRGHAFTALLLSRWAIAPAPNQNQESASEQTGTLALMRHFVTDSPQRNSALGNTIGNQQPLFP
ncbi:hypothetical protein [Vacuolonema iberomarrocanum]|uniref:hypothetical protein n=1 Tax=Vacuolonema iberomarrocanum TaxID=3454632 RepID=UPI0019F7282C|nr:hypothetical protein [filamentous cyanobacterium LEGE 07170]